MRNALAVGLGGEYVALVLQLLSEFQEVLHDAVVNDHDLVTAIGMRVGVQVRRTAMGGPSRMPDAAGPLG